MAKRLTAAVTAVFPATLCQSINRVFITGCGDSHHAAIAAELAFEQLAGLPCEAMTAMQMARYAAGFLPDGGSLVMGVSVSGQASRTVEAVNMARQVGATAVAVTGNSKSPLAQTTQLILETAVPPLPDELQGLIVPGVRSYIISQLALFLTAVHLGQRRGHLPPTRANQVRHQLVSTAAKMTQTISNCGPICQQMAERWSDADQFHFCGAGPNYATAMFNAAKILEASGDTAVAQDTEEWAHLQYFSRQVDTPTFFISNGGWDASRVLEVTAAAKQIGRRVVLIAPENSTLARTAVHDILLPISGKSRECFSPLLTCLPGILFAAYRAQVVGESYFRGFGGGRSAEGGGGISRIRTSRQINRPHR